MGNNINQFGEKTRVTIQTASLAEDFINYNPETNAIVVIGYQLSQKYIGTWKINVVSEYVDPRGRYHKFESDYELEVYEEKTTQIITPQQDEKEQEPIYQEVSDFDGIVVLEAQDELDRPVPYIANFTPTGLMTIAWDRKMKAYEKPQEIPATKVAVDVELVQAEILEQQPEGLRRRKLNQSPESADEILMRDEIQREIRRMMILDALEVKMVSDQDSEELTVLKKFSWDVVDFFDDKILIQIDFENPDDLGQFF